MTRECRPQNEFHHHQMEMKGLSTREMKETEEKNLMDQADMVTGTKGLMHCQHSFWVRKHMTIRGNSFFWGFGLI